MTSLSKLTSVNYTFQGSVCLEGFTLVELLVVIGIMVAIIAFTVPTMNSVMGGSQITQAGQMVGDQLGLARQTALSKNHSIEVRFYQYGDPDIPGEQTNAPSAGQYRAFQLFEIQESGSNVAVGKIQRIPSSIIIDSGTTFSSIIGLASTAVPTLTQSTAPQTVSLPRVLLNYNSVSFRFLPDGSTNLSPKPTQWFLTMRNINDLATPPKNFITIQIDAINGHIKTYRP